MLYSYFLSVKILYKITGVLQFVTKCLTNKCGKGHLKIASSLFTIKLYDIYFDTGGNSVTDLHHKSQFHNQMSCCCINVVPSNRTSNHTVVPRYQ